MWCAAPRHAPCIIVRPYCWAELEQKLEFVACQWPRNCTRVCDILPCGTWAKPAGTLVQHSKIYDMSKCKTRQDWELAVQFSAWSEICFSQKYIPRIRLTVHMVTGYIVISQLLYSLIQSVLCKFHGRAVHKSLLLWYECTAVHCTGYSFVLELEV